MYARANPLPGARAKVPVLEVDDGSGTTSVLTESMVVAEYVGEKFPDAGLLPEGSEDRATMRLFSELCGSSSFSYFGILKAAKGDPSQLEEAVAGLTQGLVNANAFLEAKGDAKGPFLFGERFTLAECNTAPFVQRACFTLPLYTDVDPLKICDDLKLARLKAWMTATIARPSVQATKVPDAEWKESVNRMLQRFSERK